MENPSEEKGSRLAKALRITGGVGFTPELPLMLGTGLVEMAGKGIGTLAGMAGSKLRGENVDWDAASDTAADLGAFTYEPRLRGNREALEAAMPALEWYEDALHQGGGKIAEVTGSPAVGAIGYGMGSLIDPWDMVPLGAMSSALRKASKLSREVPSVEVKSTGLGGKQRGAYSPGELSRTVEGDFELRSPTLDAFDSLKPQEQTRLPGRQLLQALRREGAKAEELKWSGLDRLLDTDEVVSVADARRAAEQNRPKYEWEKQEGSGGIDEGEFEEQIMERARENAWNDDALVYPEEVKILDQYGEEINTAYDIDGSSFNEGEWRAAYEQDQRDYHRDRIEYDPEGELSPSEFADYQEAVAEGRSGAWLDEYADNMARNDANEIEFVRERDYDAEPTNLDELTEYWENEIRSDPESYGIDAIDAGEPEHGGYTVSREQHLGRPGEDAYAVNLLRLESEGRYGRGMQGGPDATFPTDPTYDPVLRQREIERIAEREALDPNDLRRARGKFQGSHFDENLMFTRETRLPITPEWASEEAKALLAQLRRENAVPHQNPVPLLEEAQSDVLQRGRKSGLYDPLDPKFHEKATNEAARVEAFKQSALAETHVARADPRVTEFMERLERQAKQDLENGVPEHQRYASERLGELRGYQKRIEDLPPDADFDAKVRAEQIFWDRVYQYANVGDPVEAYASQIRQGLDRLSNMTRTPFADKSVPAAPLAETKQYMAMALRKHLADAVARGDQFFAITPGEVHSRRWGSDSIQWARDPNDPSRVLIDDHSYSGRRGREGVERHIEHLRSGNARPEWTTSAIDPERELLRNIVDARLSHGTHDYPDPTLFRQKRAEALAKLLRDKPEGHYSPRAFGNEQAYNFVESDLQRLIKESGSKAVIRDIEMPDGQIIRGIEIDPELASAAKRGFKIPY